MPKYRELNDVQLIETLQRLEARIHERFPDRGLAGVATELVALAPKVAKTARSLSKPNLLLRLFVLILLAAGIGLVFLLGRALDFNGVELQGLQFFAGLEALLNVIILFSAGIWFLLTLETRTKRRRALDQLHELRSVAHVIDTHQLTKTPVSVLEGSERTASSPARDLTPFQLRRYLDYCSEMLSLTGKLSALYLAHSRDAITIQAVNEVEELTSDFSRKIWQKIAVI